MKAEEIMTSSPRTVTQNQTVAEAVGVMTTENCGIVPVVESEGSLTIVGVITDRDIALRACGTDGSGPQSTVSSIMTSNVFCVAPQDDISRISHVMESAGVRRVPVVSDEQQLVGIISFKDLASNTDDAEVGSLESTILELDPNNS
ncbi:MAG: CBS domain-containing protein [bacterium]|nr:CBS domain-containing protein [Candidatus Kapabacteria bacterium]